MRFRKILIIFGCLILVAATGLGILLSFMNKPSMGTVNNPKVTSTAAISAGINMSPKLFSSNYASFDYPIALKIDTKNTTHQPIIDDYNFSLQDIEPWNLAITIFSVPEGTLSGNNAFLVRQMNPAQYQQSSTIVNGTNVIMMSDKTITYYNEVAFLVRGSYQATISLSGNDSNGRGNLIKTMNMILDSWTWKVD